MDNYLKYAWQQTVVDAFLSVPEETAGKIAIAKRTISARLKQSYELDPAERVALDDALRALRVLASETKFPWAEYGEGEKKIA